MASRGLGLAFGFVLPVIALWLLGRWVDRRFDLAPWAQLVGTLAGWVLGFFYVYYASQRES